jgi:tetratricopeptide (TPR) repeat protein
MNGNLVSLEIVEDDFSELESIWFEQNQKEDLPQIKETVATIEKVPMKTEDLVHKAPIVKKVKPKKKIFISSEVSSKKSDSLSFIKKKFYATNSSKFSIKLAKKFYELKSYKKALKWVLITNEIDSKSEDSWLMFAKVKDKMGKPNDAITALNQYLKQNSSTRVKKLLIDLKKRV